ncbi:hypothetical protein [uncultured Algibacter sp.]|uniref:hypothetical protein n=1 Tax=uncultured Algibacter sp. TaxID=298659 RepID=UPI00261F6340|nr:hypothetical protein [uncultured Algibacter sp.]
MKLQNTAILIILLFITGCGMKSKQGLIKNYEENKTGIIELKDYYNGLVPKYYRVRIRYNSSDDIDLIVYQPTENTEKRELLFRQWNLDLDDYDPEPQTDYEKKYHGNTNSLEIVMEKLNWTNETIAELYNKLDDVNCIGISNWNPTEIEYGYKGMGVFSYLVFDENSNSELQEKYSDGCTQMFYKDNIVLSYASGAIGSLCTPEFKRAK